MGLQNITSTCCNVIGTNVQGDTLVYGSTEYNKEIHVVIGTNVLSVWVYRI